MKDYFAFVLGVDIDSEQEIGSGLLGMLLRVKIKVSLIRAIRETSLASPGEFQLSRYLEQSRN
jgi:hypothetical protein